ncbi:CaiB/BaiF CoA-transferase family protein [Bordetella sp. BOR01]|uniref:CaiB/BaiF CoA transferase family protein n=1 Tax=Bordetella sp. BOR01 TaxID=2854779 RepID=UPI001C485C70|nr:CaiB/BaiF CoA-transferase family protein [Bordetella sp. BOR01]MBV7486460.1 CoA transferase [Bordetella sp. BOR01]
MGNGNQGGPLAGVRVLDLGTMLAGPFTGTLLGDFGADVIKIEQPGSGDPMRTIGPYVNGESLWWNVESRNKRSVCLDLRRDEGKALIHELVVHADVLIENFRPGTMDRWGLSYEALSKINPRLVVASVSGFGQTGPYAARPAYDRMAQAFSGILNITGYADRPPVRPGVALADYGTAVFAAFSIMMALFHRDARGGSGQHLDVAMYEAMFRLTDSMLSCYEQLGITRERRGNENPNASPGDHFETADGRFIAITVSSDALFQRLCRAMGREDLCNDERFALHDARAQRLTEINGVVGEWVRSMSAKEACARLEAAQQPHCLIYGVREIMEDPHYQARESFVTVNHPRIGPFKMQSVAPRMLGTPAPPIRPAPQLGDATRDVLASLLGKSDEEIRCLADAGVIFVGREDVLPAR